MNLFQKTLSGKNESRPPVWFMRQAGRYHAHYQSLKKSHTFETLCKTPALACEVTMGPIRDFDFDAAILFSDILYPLEAMGMPLKFSPGPKLGFHLKTMGDLERIRGGREAASFMNFQAEACKLIRAALPQSKGLIGFVGSPLTLFYYAVAGSHSNSLKDAFAGLYDGRHTAFFNQLAPLLIENMLLQARSGIDAIALFDTCAGEVDLKTYENIVVPALKEVLTEFRLKSSDTKIIYYSKNTNAEYFRKLKSLPIDVLGVDHHNDLEGTLKEFSDRYLIQGNFDQNLLPLPHAQFRPHADAWFQRYAKLEKSLRSRWICGLGHGVLQHTPEANVKYFIKREREIFL